MTTGETLPSSQLTGLVTNGSFAALRRCTLFTHAEDYGVVRLVRARDVDVGHVSVTGQVRTQLSRHRVTIRKKPPSIKDAIARFQYGTR